MLFLPRLEESMKAHYRTMLRDASRHSEKCDSAYCSWNFTDRKMRE
ncbi:hypothetical protein VP96_00187 [Vibrio cholerae]|nr:hypothetical protein VP96_00187 [Vibrio cholerae]